MREPGGPARDRPAWPAGHVPRWDGRVLRGPHRVPGQPAPASYRAARSPGPPSSCQPQCGRDVLNLVRPGTCRGGTRGAAAAVVASETRLAWTASARWWPSRHFAGDRPGVLVHGALPPAAPRCDVSEPSPAALSRWAKG